MKWFYNMKIGTKLITAFIIVSVIAGIVGAVGIFEISRTDKNYSDLYDNYGISLSYLTEVTETFQRTRVNLRDMMLDENDQNKQKYYTKIKDFEKTIIDNMEKYGKTTSTPEEKAAFAEMKDAWEKFLPIRDKEINLALAHHEDQAQAVSSGEGYDISQRIDDSIKKNIDLNVEIGNSMSEEYSANARTTIITMVVIVLVCMFIAIMLGIFISRIISNPVKKLVEAAGLIADGDLDVAVEADTRDEIGTLASAFVKMADNLNEVMGNISTASEQVASGAKQVSESSIALSQGATEQATSVEQLTASLEEISSQTKQNADNANLANDLAENAKSYALQGNTQMNEMLKSMDEINDASSNISKIIKVIDEIAFQTNILALNAAVEAARAGQHGKGFAVVAEEVRNLAARSANAAKETTAMIEGSIKKVEGGTRIANETANALNKIVDGITKAATLVGEIAAASNEQAAGIAQVNQGIMQVSQVVQTNSATSQESAAASEELSGQAGLLKEQVSRFKLRKAYRSSSYRGLESINPEVLRMLESINGQSKSVPVNEALSEAAASRGKIALSDREFGKY